jgi:hypothetical protein
MTAEEGEYIDDDNDNDKKFWEEIIPYFFWYDTGRTETQKIKVDPHRHG